MDNTDFASKYLEALRQGRFEVLKWLGRESRYIRVLIAFDMDGVLVRQVNPDCPNYDSMNATRYIPENVRLFMILNQDPFIDCCILTGRHEKISMEIHKRFDCQVYCRFFDPDSEFEESLFKQVLIEYKTEILNFLSENYDKVIYIDNHIEKFNPEEFTDKVRLFDMEQFSAFWRGIING